MMNESRALVLLGILMAQSQHGYQINDFIERNLSNVTDMKKATAYSMLDKLHTHGYIDIHTEQNGNRPARKVYSVNEKGKSYFLELLRKNLGSDHPTTDPSDLGLMFIDYLPIEERIASLEQRYQRLQKQLNFHQQIPWHGDNVGISFVIERKQVLLQADIKWLEEFIQKCKQQLKP